MYSKVFLRPDCDRDEPAALPLFQAQQVQGGRPDGYWIEAFPFSTSTTRCPHIVGYGLGTNDRKSDIEMFLNPYASPNDSSSNWTSVILATLEFPVAMHYADVTGNGFNDIIISDRYGSSMATDINPNGGRVLWLENTGDPHRGNWTQRVIGRSPGMHRLKTGHFTRKDRLQVCAIPIVVASGDLTTAAPVIIFTCPEDPRRAETWPSTIVAHKTLVHEIVVVPSHGDTPYDQIVLAGRDGVDVLWCTGDPSSWKSVNIGSELPSSPGNPYWGAGSVAVGRIGDDYAGYICSAEAFHGNTVAVYTKPSDSPHGIIKSKWTRHQLDNYGSLNGEHTGSIHHVVCADIDGDGTDEFLVAMMGSDPPDFARTGVWCYKLIDKVKGTVSKTKLSNTSAGRIATGHFLPRAPQVDFATISYSVPNYFESPNPSINVFFSTGILAEKLDQEVYFRIVRAGTTRFTSEVEFLDVAGKKLTLVVLPPRTPFKVEKGASAVKVMAGTVSWDGGKEQRFPATRPFGRDSLVVTSDQLESGDEGAIFALFKPSKTSGTPPFSSMDQLHTHNIFPPWMPNDVRAMKFPFIKVEDLPWAHGRFKDLEFYNLVGYHVRFADDSMDELAHVQLWTAGKGVSAGFHNHVEKSFAEIHACIVNGTGKGGMRWAKVEDKDFDPDKPDLSNTDLIVVPDLHEHGPLWRTRPDGQPIIRMNDTVDYPWHAWLAGPKDDGPQAYDVWVAFEFPSFQTNSTPRPDTAISDGMYTITFEGSNRTLALKGGDATDGTPIVAVLAEKKQQWKVYRVPGTDVYEISHEQTGSLVCARWPPVSGQRVVGTHSPANMGLTSRWALAEKSPGHMTIRLANIQPGQDLLFLDTAPGLGANQASEAPVVVEQNTSAQAPSLKLSPA